MPAALQRYVAFLRGVSPLNAEMPELRRVFESAGFVDVQTVLGSGNVVFSAPRVALKTLAKRCEAAMTRELGASFFTLVRPVATLSALLDSRPFAGFRLGPGAKRVVTFLAEPPKRPVALPAAQPGFRILSHQHDIVLSAHQPGGPHGSALMARLERTFGKAITTRTIDTLGKCVKASEAARPVAKPTRAAKTRRRR